MSGHSKWAKVKHVKAKLDAIKGRAFTKVIKEISIAAREGGGDPALNPRLRSALQAAKDANMPKDNIERAIKKGTGELEGVNYEEVTYEGYAPGGVAIMIRCLTDNRNRSVAEISKLIGKSGGNMGVPGCVSFMFEAKGYFYLSREDNSRLTDDIVMESVLEAGCEDYTPSEDGGKSSASPLHSLMQELSLRKRATRSRSARSPCSPKRRLRLQETMFQRFSGWSTTLKSMTTSRISTTTPRSLTKIWKRLLLKAEPNRSTGFDRDN